MFKICGLQCGTIISSRSKPRRLILTSHYSCRYQAQPKTRHNFFALESSDKNVSKHFVQFGVKYKRFYHRGEISHAKIKKLLPFETETKVLNDVMLFKNENGTFYRIVSAFGLAQLLFWLYLAKFSLQSTKDVSREEEAVLVERHREAHPRTVLFWEWLHFGDKYKYGITFLFSAVGYLVALGSCLYTLRSVRYLVLLKGGEFVRIITYAPVGARRITVPLSYVSGQHSLSPMKPYYAFKVKGFWFNFLVDMKGQLLEPKLFENTIGVGRSIKKK